MDWKNVLQHYKHQSAGYNQRTCTGRDEVPEPGPLSKLVAVSFEVVGLLSPPLQLPPFLSYAANVLILHCKNHKFTFTFKSMTYAELSNHKIAPQTSC